MNALKLLAANEHNHNITIVHGIVMGSGDIAGEMIVHAWVEDKIYCYDLDGRTMKTESCPISLYYKLGKIDRKNTIRYTRKEIVRLTLENGHMGPFDDKLMKHAIAEKGRSITHEVLKLVEENKRKLNEL